MEKKCSYCNGSCIDIDDKVVCTECGNIKSELGSLVNEVDYSAPSNIIDHKRQAKNSGKRGLFSNTGSSGPYHERFENKLDYICTQLKIPVSLKHTMRNHYYLAFSKWRSIRKIDPTFNYVCAALAHIVFRMENKPTTLADIGIKLNLKYYTIGKLSMKIQSVAQIIVEELSEFGYLDRGCEILRKLYSYSDEECESIKRLASELIKFSKIISLSDGRNPTSIYCASLYLAQCYKLTTVSQDILNHFSGNSNNNNNDINKNNKNDENGSYYRTLVNDKQIGTVVKNRRKSKNKANEELMKPFLNDLVEGMNAPSHATLCRVKEIESNLTNYSQKSPFFSRFVNSLTLHQWLPMILKDFLINQQPDDTDKQQEDTNKDDQEETSNEDNEEEIEKMLLRKDDEEEDESYEEDEEVLNNFNRIVDDENPSDISTNTTTTNETTAIISSNIIGNKRSNNQIFVDDENPNVIKRLKSPEKQIIINNSNNNSSSTNSFNNNNSGDEDDKLSDYKSTISLATSNSTTTSATFRMKKFKELINNNPNTILPPAYIKSEYKKTTTKLRIIQAKFILFTRGEIEESRITYDDIEYHDKYKNILPNPNNKIDISIQKLILEGVSDNDIINGYTDYEKVQLDQKIENKKQDLDKEELSDSDIADDKIYEYIRSNKEKEEWKSILKSTYSDLYEYSNISNYN